MKQDGLDTMDKSTISAVLWLQDDHERMTLLGKIRDSMTAGEHSRLRGNFAKGTKNTLKMKSLRHVPKGKNQETGQNRLK